MDGCLTTRRDFLLPPMKMHYFIPTLSSNDGAFSYYQKPRIVYLLEMICGIELRGCCECTIMGSKLTSFWN